MSNAEELALLFRINEMDPRKHFDAIVHGGLQTTSVMAAVVGLLVPLRRIGRNHRKLWDQLVRLIHQSCSRQHLGDKSGIAGFCAAMTGMRERQTQEGHCPSGHGSGAQRIEASSETATGEAKAELTWTATKPASSSSTRSAELLVCQRFGRLSPTPSGAEVALSWPTNE